MTEASGAARSPGAACGKPDGSRRPPATRGRADPAGRVAAGGLRGGRGRDPAARRRPAFPAQSSRNAIAAHYCPSPEDETRLRGGRRGQARHRRARGRLGRGHRTDRERGRPRPRTSRCWRRPRSRAARRRSRRPAPACQSRRLSEAIDRAMRGAGVPTRPEPLRPRRGTLDRALPAARCPTCRTTRATCWPRGWSWPSSRSPPPAAGTSSERGRGRGVPARCAARAAGGTADPAVAGGRCAGPAGPAVRAAAARAPAPGRRWRPALRRLRGAARWRPIRRSWKPPGGPVGPGRAHGVRGGGGGGGPDALTACRYLRLLLFFVEEVVGKGLGAGHDARDVRIDRRRGAPP